MKWYLLCRVVETNDVRTVMSCIDDVALGDVIEEEGKQDR